MPNDTQISVNGTDSTVSFLIRIDGEEVPQSFEIATLVVTKEVNKISNAKVIIIDGDASNEDFPASNEEYFIPGKEIEILLGYEASEDLVFKGIIVKHNIKIRKDGKAQLKLDCRDEAFKTTLSRKNKYFFEATDSDVISEILDSYGLDIDIEDTTATHQELIQFEATDWDFILARADVNGKLCFNDDGTFAVKAPDLSQDPLYTLRFGDNLLEFDGEIDARLQYNTVKATSWDFANQEMLEVEGVDPGLEEAGNLEASSLAEVGAVDELLLRHGGQLVQDELQAWADAQLLKTRLAKIRGRAQFKGVPDIKPGAVIQLEGVGDRFTGKAFVSGIRHEFTEGDWRVNAQLGIDPSWFTERKDVQLPAASGLLPSIHGLQIAVVTELEGDPEGESRIKIKLPVISAEEDGAWARIGLMDAGNERGMFFMPEIDDEVIVGFINNDPREPIILGMLHSSASPPSFELSNDNHEKGYTSREGMKITFNDETKQMLLETPAGKVVTLDDDQGVIQLEDDNGNKILMDSDGITIESSGELKLVSSTDFKLESGSNLEIKASANFKAEGSAGAEVKSSATAVLKGALVQIN